MKTTRHSLMAKGIMVLLSLLVLIFAFTYSWFRDPSAPVEASGLTMSVRNTTTDFEYAIGFSTSQTGYTYKHTAFTNTVNQDLNLERLFTDDDTGQTNPINLLYDYTPVDVTGDGVTLIRPAMEYGNWKINGASGNYSTAEPNVQYISFDLIFRTKVQNTTVKLDAGSTARGNCENNAGDGKLKTNPVYAVTSTEGGVPATENISNYNKDNKYGAFSRDAIVGAVRVAFLNYADENHELTSTQIVEQEQTEYEDTPALLWIPRPDLFLSNGATSLSAADLAKDGNTTGWDLITGISSGTQVLNSKAMQDASYSTFVHQYYNIFESRTIETENDNPVRIKTYEGAIPSTVNSSASGDKVYFGQQQPIVTLSYLEDTNNNGVHDDNEYYYGKVRVRIWLEGTDSESRRALAGGKFSVSFNITG